MTLVFSWERFFNQLFFHILFSSASRAHLLQEDLCFWQKAVVVACKHHYQRCQLTRNVLEHESILEALVIYVQARLTLIFNTISCGL